MIAFFGHQTVRRPNVGRYINLTDLQDDASAINMVGGSLTGVSETSAMLIGDFFRKSDFCVLH